MFMDCINAGDWLGLTINVPNFITYHIFTNIRRTLNTKNLLKIKGAPYIPVRFLHCFFLGFEPRENSFWHLSLVGTVLRLFVKPVP